MLKLNRRQFLYTAAASGAMPSLGACLKEPEYLGEKWWTTGGFKPVPDEVEISEFLIEGEIPKHLNGLYIRNGGNYRGEEAPHYFTGDGMLHGLWLENGRARHYRNRWVQTSLIQENKSVSLDKADNMSNTSIIHYNDRLLSLMEIGFPYEINDDLSTKGVFRFDGTLEAAMTAHPKIHPTTKELQFFSTSFFSNPYLHYREVNPKGEITRRVDIDLPASSMQHDFQRTENFVLFLDLPIIFSKRKAIRGEFPYEWRGDSYDARIGVLPREGDAGDIRWFSVETGFVFHTVNAYEEEDGTIVLQVSRGAQMWVETPYHINEPVYLYEYRIHPEHGILSEGQKGDIRVDFGTVDPRYSGLQHQTSFFSTLTPSGTEATDYVRFSGLISYTNSGNVLSEYRYADYIDGGEFFFVPLSEDAPEGAGHLMGFVYDRREDQSYFDIFDAENISAGPVARVQIGRRVPCGFHGTFVPNLTPPV